MDLYNQLKGIDLGSQSDDYFRNLSPMFSRGRQDAIDYYSKMRDQDPTVVAQRQQEQAKKDLAAKAAQDKIDTANRFAQNKTELTDFNTRYGAAVPQIINDTSNKYQLGDLLGQANSLNTRVKDLQGNISGQGAGGYANSSQVDAAVNSKYLPRYQTAITNLQTGTALANAEQNQLLKPYETEADLLNQRIAREATGYSQEQQRELDGLIAAMNAGNQLSQAQIQQATALAQLESSYKQAIDVEKLKKTETPVNAKDNYVSIGDGLYNIATGQIIQKPKTEGDGKGW